MKLKTSKKGFTLVELVIVIAVLAIIAAIAIPSVTGVIKNANTATDKSNAQAIEATIKTFRAEAEADSTHPMSADKKALVGSTKLHTIDLLKAYGINSIPKVKSYPKGVFLWDNVTQTVSISDTDKITGNDVILGDKLGKDTIAHLSLFW